MNASPVVVKVGGSFAHYPGLQSHVAGLANAAGRVAIVPGGGPFADQVRSEQRRIGFDDGAAHRMALLAMAQFGCALASFSPVLAAAGSIDDVRKCLDGGKVPVWLPLQLLDGEPAIPETWDATSDSLAVWLAGRIGAGRLIFLKRARKPRSMKLADLVADGFLDPLVPEFLAEARVEAWLCGPLNLKALATALAAGSLVGSRIDLA